MDARSSGSNKLFSISALSEDIVLSMRLCLLKLEDVYQTPDKTIADWCRDFQQLQFTSWSRMGGGRS